MTRLTYVSGGASSEKNGVFGPGQIGMASPSFIGNHVGGINAYFYILVRTIFYRIDFILSDLETTAILKQSGKPTGQKTA